MSDVGRLDDVVASVARDLEQADVREPQLLALLATGPDLLPERLEGGEAFELSRCPSVPPAWREATLYHGALGGLSAWILEDRSHDPREPERAGDPPWHAGFPIWLAAKCGALAMLHTSAASSLAAEPAAGRLTLLRDHLNLSGASPLTGLGESTLGPLFPDTTYLHDPALRAAALACAKEHGLTVTQVVAACTPAPHLDTPAERAFYARAGADVCAQGLAVPLLCAAHAGLALCAIAAVTDGPDEVLDVSRLLERAEALAPELEELLVAVCTRLAADGALDLEGHSTTKGPSGA